jgi:hypothetical protein
LIGSLNGPSGCIPIPCHHRFDHFRDEFSAGLLTESALIIDLCADINDRDRKDKKSPARLHFADARISRRQRA